MISGDVTATDSNPHSLYESLSAAWYVLRTKPRQEKRAQKNLQEWGLETLLPVWPDRRKHPRPSNGVGALFPSYLFCRFTDSYFGKIRYTHGVAHIVSFGGTPAVVHQSIMDELQARLDPDGVFCDERCGIVPAPLVPLQPGDRVAITSGVLANMTGIFKKELSDGERVKILLDTVQMRSVVTLDRADVVKVG